MDGTVLDTEPLHEKAWNVAMRERGYTITEEMRLRMVGTSVEDIRLMIDERCKSTEVFPALSRRVAVLKREYKKDHIPLKKGFNKLSDFLQGQGIKQLVVTSSLHEDAILDLRTAGVFERFHGIIGFEDAPKGKPYPEPYLKGAAIVGVGADECLAVEDSYYGVTAAYNACMKCVYIKDTVDIPGSAHAFIYKELDSLEGVIDIIKSMNDIEDS